jgi:hypothetical protein
MIARPLLTLALLATTPAQADFTFPKTGGANNPSLIEQQCVGKSVEDAKRSCFEDAIEKVAGQVIIMDNTARVTSTTTKSLSRSRMAGVSGISRCGYLCLVARSHTASCLFQFKSMT